MNDVNDMNLLREYAARNSETAFAEIVRRNINLVYSVALRYLGNSSDAQDVAQAVFIILARKAAGLRERATLTGWLYETTRFAAARMRRTNARRQDREQEAYMQSTLNETDTTDAWSRLAPHLEDAMSRLGEKDRTLVALRFFENKSVAETAALLGIAEWTARKRAERAVEKLRTFFTRRGVTLSGAAIAGAVSANSVSAAPALLAQTTTTAALAKGATASLSTLTLVKAVTVKSAATFGPLAGLPALLGSAYISFKAYAADAKSLREQEFVLRILWQRTFCALLLMAFFFTALKFGFFRAPVHIDYFAAACVLYICADAVLWSGYQSQRRRQMQIEDGTYVEAEWTQPRKLTDPAAVSAGTRLEKVLKGLRFTAFTAVTGAILSALLSTGLIAMVVVTAEQSLKHNLPLNKYAGFKEHFEHVIVRNTLVVYCLGQVWSAIFIFRGWQNTPRFKPMRSGRFFHVVFPIWLAVITLFLFNLHQYFKGFQFLGPAATAGVLLPAGVLAFNLAVVLAYAGFIMRLIRRRPLGFKPTRTGLFFRFMLPIWAALVVTPLFNVYCYSSFYQSQAGKGADLSSLASPSEFLVFNLVVVLVCSVFIAVAGAWRKKNGVDQDWNPNGYQPVSSPAQPACNS